MELKFTIEDAKRWAGEKAASLDEARTSCDDQAVQQLNRIIPEKAKELWDSGCWLEAALQDCGATAEEVSAIQFAHGQRSFLGDPWKIAVAYANEFAMKGETRDKPGMELASEICREMFDGPTR